MNRDKGGRFLKRKRIDDEEAEFSHESVASPTLCAEDHIQEIRGKRRKQHARYYFNDGNIILLAEDTIFRVHKGILMLHSGFFERLLNESQVTDVELVDGCPLVPTLGRAVFVEQVLETMYNGASTELLPTGPPDPSELPTLVRLCRLGSRYEVRHMMDHTYKRLLLLFPTDSLDDWQLRVQSHDGVRQIADGIYLVTRMIKFLQLRARKIIPLVLYAYCQLPLTAVVWNNKSGVSSPLERGDMYRCLLAIPQLSKRKIEMYNVFTAPKRNRQRCRSVSCDERLLRLSHDAMERDDATLLSDPLEDLMVWCRDHKLWKKMCSACANWIEAEIKRLREATWNDLGKIFDVPEWQADDV